MKGKCMFVKAAIVAILFGIQSVAWAAYGEGLLGQENVLQWFEEAVSTYANDEDLSARGYELPKTCCVDVCTEDGNASYLDIETLPDDGIYYTPETEGNSSVISRVTFRVMSRVGSRLPKVDAEDQAGLAVAYDDGVATWFGLAGGTLTNLHSDVTSPTIGEWYDIMIELDNREGHERLVRYSAKLAEDSEFHILSNGGVEWFPNSNSSSLRKVSSIGFAGDMKLGDFAGFEVDERKDVTFDVNGGEDRINAGKYVAGQSFGELPVPSRGGYKFLGWFTAADGGSVVTASTVVSESMTLYAHWIVALVYSSNDDGTITITGFPDAVLPNLSIPSTYDGMNVSKIGDHAFSNCTGLVSVVIPGSVWDIGEGAFASCTGLRRVEVAKVLQSQIESRGVFEGCSEDLEIVYISPEIRNVTAKQRYPWNGLVDITCQVTGMDSTTKPFEFTVSVVNQDSGDVKEAEHFWVVRDGVKSTDRTVQTNGDYRLLWDAGVDLDAGLYSNMVVRVNCVAGHEKVQLWKDGPYWATVNIGAEEPWESGYYFWWGDTVGYKRENNAWVASDGSASGFSFGLKNEGWIDANSTLLPEHDAAHVQWGGAWRMPTLDELNGLINNCVWVWVTTNGVNGYIVRGRGDYASANIFLPCAGYGYGTSLYFAGSRGYYWSSVPYSGNGYSWTLYFSSSYHRTDGNYRDCGRSVRSVQGFTE